MQASPQGRSEASRGLLQFESSSSVSSERTYFLVTTSIAICSSVRSSLSPQSSASTSLELVHQLGLQAIAAMLEAERTKLCVKH